MYAGNKRINYTNAHVVGRGIKAIGKLHHAVEPYTRKDQQTIASVRRKMKEDEEKSSLPAQLLLQFGLQSLHFVLSVAPPKTAVTIITEQENYYDYWNRQLGYVILPGGICLNELLLQNGYAKATQQYYCGKLAEHQAMNRQAQLNSIGIYSQIKVF